MRLRLEADAEELRDRGSDLVRALAHQIENVAPDLASDLEKALPHKEEELKYPVLRYLKKITTAEYDHQLGRMLQDIGDVLTERPLRKAFGDPPDPDEEGDEGEKEEPLEPGDYDPKNDEMVPEPEEDDEDEDEGEEKSLNKGIDHTERIAKALETIATREADALIKAAKEVSRENGSALYYPVDDHTEAIAEKDGEKYAKVQGELKVFGFEPEDYETGGRLHGFSVNQLIDLVRELRNG